MRQYPFVPPWITVVCTGRHTHAVTEAIQDPPNLDKEAWRIRPSRIEFRCPQCPCTVRLGGRQMQRLTGGAMVTPGTLVPVNANVRAKMPSRVEVDMSFM